MTVDEKDKMKRCIRVVLWGMVSLACMVFIFYMSHKPAEESSGMSGTITEWLLSHGIGESIALSLDTIIRKCAHMAEYLALTFCLLQLLINMRGVWNFRVGVCGGLFSLVYAISDEVHQLFVEGRAGRATDVLIDTVGILLAVVFIIGIKKITTYRGKKAKTGDLLKN